MRLRKGRSLVVGLVFALLAGCGVRAEPQATFRSVTSPAPARPDACWPLPVKFDFATRVRSDTFYETRSGGARRRILIDAFERNSDRISKLIHESMTGPGFPASAGVEALKAGSRVRYRIPDFGVAVIVVHPLVGAPRDFVVRSQVELNLPPSSFTTAQLQTCPTPDGYKAARKAGSA